jgi:PleD family two-component response regulator
MARIVIMGHSSTSVLLKRALEREDHQVKLVSDWQGLLVNIEDPALDLVLFHREDPEWTAFNQ